MTIETWKPVVGYEWLYEVSDFGRVRSLPRYGGAVPGRRSGRMYGGAIVSNYTPKCSLYSDGIGYSQVVLHGHGVGKSRRVHQLVLEAFVGPKPDKWHGCHNDGDKTNNHLSNLRWDTHKNNFADKHKHGTDYQGERHPRATFCELDIWLIRNINASYDNLAEFFGTSYDYIYKIKVNRAWPHVA